MVCSTGNKSYGSHSTTTIDIVADVTSRDIYFGSALNDTRHGVVLECNRILYRVGLALENITTQIFYQPQELVDTATSAIDIATIVELRGFVGIRE